MRAEPAAHPANARLGTLGRVTFLAFATLARYDQTMSAGESYDSPTAGADGRHTRRFNWPANMLLVLTLTLVLLAGIVAGSFLRFARDIVTMTPPRTITEADGIVVLTGAASRIYRAVALLEEGRGKRLLISGVYPTTTGRRIQQELAAEPALFDCCVDLGHDALDTRGNANETALWARDNGYDAIIVVTSNYHMPRSLMELRRVDPGIRLIPYPVVDWEFVDLDWKYATTVLRRVLVEYGKFVMARFRPLWGGNGGNGLRSSLPTAASGAANAAETRAGD